MCAVGSTLERDGSYVATLPYVVKCYEGKGGVNNIFRFLILLLSQPKCNTGHWPIAQITK